MENEDYTVLMGRRLTIPVGQLLPALAYCESGTKGARTAVSVEVLKLLRDHPAWSAEKLAKRAGCNRKHVFKTIRQVSTLEFNKLTGDTFRRTKPLNKKRERELRQKLGSEFFDAKDVTAWYENWSQKSVTEWAAYKWCQRLNKPLHLFGRPVKARLARRSRKTFRLDRAQIRELRDRQKLERRSDGINGGSLRSPYQENPVLRIEAVLRYGTTPDTLREVSKHLRTDAGRWFRSYAENRDIDELCAVGSKRSRARRNLGPVDSEA